MGADQVPRIGIGAHSHDEIGFGGGGGPVNIRAGPGDIDPQQAGALHEDRHIRQPVARVQGDGSGTTPSARIHKRCIE